MVTILTSANRIQKKKHQKYENIQVRLLVFQTNSSNSFLSKSELRFKLYCFFIIENKQEENILKNRLQNENSSYENLVMDQDNKLSLLDNVCIL